MNDEQLIQRFLAMKPGQKLRGTRGNTLFIRGDALHHYTPDTTLACWHDWQGRRVVFCTSMDLATRSKWHVHFRARSPFTGVDVIRTPDPLRPDAERALGMHLDGADEAIKSSRRARDPYLRYNSRWADLHLETYASELTLWGIPEPAHLAEYRKRLEHEAYLLKAQRLIAA